MNRIWVARDNDGEINVFVDSPRWLPTLFRGCWRGNEGDHTTPVARGECVEYVRADTVSDSNPWRYPERSELPEKPGLYDASGDFWGDQPQFIAGLFWTGEYWYWSETSDTNEEEDLNRVVYAWRESTIPAPRLNAITQENEILKILNRPGRRYGASALHEILVPWRGRWPLTSIRRALTNLEKRGLVRKCEEVTVGAYGRNEHLWELKK